MFSALRRNTDLQDTPVLLWRRLEHVAPDRAALRPASPVDRCEEFGNVAEQMEQVEGISREKDIVFWNPSSSYACSIVAIGVLATAGTNICTRTLSDCTAPRARPWSYSYHILRHGYPPCPCVVRPLEAPQRASWPVLCPVARFASHVYLSSPLEVHTISECQDIKRPPPPPVHAQTPAPSVGAVPTFSLDDVERRLRVRGAGRRTQMPARPRGLLGTQTGMWTNHCGGGVTTVLTANAMTRGPVIDFPLIVEAARARGSRALRVTGRCSSVASHPDIFEGGTRQDNLRLGHPWKDYM
ncbi:hypothetical protein B0H14DRAFT_3880377 [Mycena olivaceomarginata]|nr:hypothetical protein B0H14DRAFT_3880377 [Mycena olivaceomarginata]